MRGCEKNVSVKARLSFLLCDWGKKCGTEKETKIHLHFPHDTYFRYYGNNYSHPADKLLSQGDRLGRRWLLQEGKNVYPVFCLK